MNSTALFTKHFPLNRKLIYCSKSNQKLLQTSEIFHNRAVQHVEKSNFPNSIKNFAINLIKMSLRMPQTF